MGDFNELAIFVDGWWPETFKKHDWSHCPGNMIALTEGRIGGVFFAKHLPIALAFSWDIPRCLVETWKDRTNRILMVELLPRWWP